MEFHVLCVTLSLMCAFLMLDAVEGKAAKTLKQNREVPETGKDGSSEKLNRVEIAKGDELRKQCPAYSYCQGKTFPASVRVQGKRVTCDQIPNPSDTCCLNQEPHYVCYNIQVDGLFLMIDTNEPTKATDFTSLCNLMLGKEDKEPGAYTAITKDPEGGQIAYRYDEWAIVASNTRKGATFHIRDLACGYKEKKEKKDN